MWQPLLKGADARAALAVVRDIAECLATRPTARAMDRVVFWAYASHQLGEPFAETAYEQALDELIDELHRGVDQLGLYGGLAGIGWTLCHVLEAEGADSLAVVDATFLDVLAVEEWRHHLDLIQGLVGFGVYFLERIAVSGASTAYEGIARVVHHLDARATTTAAGTAWHTPSNLLPSTAATLFPSGYFDCGVAHGAPGMIALLARICALDAPPTRARPLLDGAVRWVLAQRLPGKAGFPSKLVGAETHGRLRNAWCYGDAGIAAALCQSARHLDDPARRTLAWDVALESARRPADRCGVVDAALCHGAAGLAHLFDRLWQATRQPLLEDAARSWIDRTLAMRRDDGFAGFSAAKHDAQGGVEYRPDASFLDGAIGIGLALLAATSPTEPGWDRLLLCDVSPSAT